MKHPFTLLMALLCLSTTGIKAQAPSNTQYQAALESVLTDVTYYIYTQYGDGQQTYYLTRDGYLTTEKDGAGKFYFRQTTGIGLFLSPGWATDANFTNPRLARGSTGDIVPQGHLLTNANGRDDWEGQVWYKWGENYAVRATNANSANWGANSYWAVADNNNDGVPEADYSLTAQYVWQLEKTTSAEEDTDYVRLTNLPHIYINTFTGADIYSKTSYVYARMRYVDEEDNVTLYDSLQIRGRGNSTWNLAKKPYRLKFHNKEKLLGTGYAKTKKWTLLANHGDKTMLRNAITSLMGEKAGLKFNPAAKFVDLTLNGKYVGNYQLSDQVDVRPHRVNIVEQDIPLTENSDITGGYLLEVDGFFDFHANSYWDENEQRTLAPDGFYTAQQRVPVRIHYPESEDISQSQVDYISNHVNTFEQRLFGNSFQNPDQWRSMVDSTSLANWYLCTEMSGNIDGFFSTYFYKEQGDDRLFFGPLWDYDIAYGNDNRAGDTSEKMMTNEGFGTSGNGCVAWAKRFWQDPWFASLVNRRYKELVNDGMEQYLYDKLDSLVALIDASQQLNYQRWGINVRNLRECVLYSSYEQYVTDLRNYIGKHINYLGKTFAELAGEEPGTDPEEPKKPGFMPEANTYYAITNVGSGTAMDINVENDDICANARHAESETQQWSITPLANGYLHIVNRASGMALNDPTRGEPTATTLLGDTLNTVWPDSTDYRQQWDMVQQQDGRYNFVNRFSQHTANLSGGGRNDGTPVLSYTTNASNATSNNRLWLLEGIKVDDDTPTSIGQLAEYALAYDPASQWLHFGCDDPTQLDFTVRVYDQSGRLACTFIAAEGAHLGHLRHGIYLVSWREGLHNRSVKLAR